MTDTSRPDWIAVDWGTSNLRVWAMRGDAAPDLLTDSNRGMSRLKPDQFATVLDEACASIPDVMGLDAMVCGMAGARDGWQEAPYLEAPLDLATLGSASALPPVTPAGLHARILPGVCQRGRWDDDVMRGEETQLLGYCTMEPEFCGAVLLPGTHSKCAVLERGTLSRFSTAMTGELFEAISRHTVLARTLDNQQAQSAEQLEQQRLGQREGILRAVEAPELLTSLLFQVRSSPLLSGRDRYWAHGYLSGLLIGAEVSGKREWFAHQRDVPLIGNPRLVAAYELALDLLGYVGIPIDATNATLGGLSTCIEKVH